MFLVSLKGMDREPYVHVCHDTYNLSPYYIDGISHPATTTPTPETENKNASSHLGTCGMA